MSVVSSVYRRISNSLRDTPPLRLFFLHLEKCGGTSLARSVNNALSNIYFDDMRRAHRLDPVGSFQASRHLGIPVFQYREHVLHYLLADSSLKWVHGHFQFSRHVHQLYGNDWSFVTILRKPVARWVSHYYFNRYKDGDHGSIAVSMEKYANSPRGQALGRDYVDLFTGNGDYDPDSKRQPPTHEEIEAAKQSLSLFDLVGTLENISSFAVDFKEKFGIAIEFQHANKNPVAGSKSEKVSDEILQHIETLCRPNREIYQHVLSLSSSNN